MKSKVKIVTWFTYLQVLNAKWFLAILLLGMGIILAFTQSDKISGLLLNQGNSITVEKEQQEVMEQDIIKENISSAIQFLAIMILFMLIALYGANISNSVIEEKGARIIETLLCYVKPLELLSGKMFGYLLGIVTHFVAWGVVGTIVFKISNIENTIISTLFYFLNEKVLTLFLCSVILGFILYALLFMALSSFADSMQDAGTLTFPVVCILMVVYLLSLVMLKNADIVWVNVVSYLPFFSSIMSFTVIDMEYITWNEVIVRILVQMVEVIIFTVICSKIYRRGIVSYGVKKLFKR